MRKRFIVLIDLTKKSENLIRYAAEWCLSANAEFLVFLSYSIAIPGFTDEETRGKIVADSRQRHLRKLKEFCLPFIPPNLDVAFQVTEKTPTAGLELLLGEDYENLLFVGIEKATVLQKLFRSNTAISLIETVDNTLVAMPTDLASYSHEKIYVAVSEQHPFNILEFHNLLKFINTEKTSITFFYLAKPGEAIQAEEKKLRGLTELFSHRARTNYAVYEGDSPFTDIKKVINNKIDEILVVQRGSRIFTDRIFSRFLVNELVFEGQTPLIVLP